MSDNIQNGDGRKLLLKINMKMNRLMGEVSQIKREQRKIKFQMTYYQKQSTNRKVLSAKRKLHSNEELRNVVGSITSDDCISDYEGIHRKVLKENIELMTGSMALKKDNVLDELIQENCLTEDEAYSVRNTDDRKDQTRKLAVLIGKRSRATFNKYVDILSKEENYPHVGHTLKEKFQMKLRDQPRQRECIPCVIMRDVNIKDVVDKLCAIGIVDLDFVDFVASCKSYDKEETDTMWKEIFKQLRMTCSTDSRFETFRNSLSEKYEHIAKKLTSAVRLNCRCIQESFETESTEGNDDRSTTSTRNTINDYSSVLSGISEESEYSLDLNKHEHVENWVKQFAIQDEPNKSTSALQGPTDLSLRNI